MFISLSPSLSLYIYTLLFIYNMYVYIYVCIYIYICIYNGIYIYMYIYIYMSIVLNFVMFEHKWTHICLNQFIYIQTFTLSPINTHETSTHSIKHTQHFEFEFESSTLVNKPLRQQLDVHNNRNGLLVSRLKY